MMLSALAAVADVIDTMHRRLGHAVKWLALLVVLLQVTVVFLRYVFGSSFIWMQEGVVYLHAALFMLAIGYAYMLDAHVRVDFYYAHWTVLRQALVDLLGVIVCVWPFCALVVWASWGYVALSWRLGEGPMAVGGLPFTPALKSLILAMAGLLALQGLSVAIRAGLVLAGRAETLFPHKPVQKIEA